MTQRIFFTAEKAENRFFQYILGRQPSYGRMIISEQGAVKSEQGKQLHIDVFLDARYVGKGLKVESGELRKRFGKSVKLYLHLLDKKFADVLGEVLPAKATCVFEKSLPYGVREKLQHSLGTQAISCGFEEISRQAHLRATKTLWEQQQIRTACSLTEQLWQWLQGQKLLGRTELDVRGLLIAEAMRLGLEGEAFPAIIAHGTNSATPHHQSGQTAITPGPLLVDMGFRWQGYCSDMTRTVWLDESGRCWDMGCGKWRVESGQWKINKGQEILSQKQVSKNSKISVKYADEQLYLEFTTVCQVVKKAYDAAFKKVKPGISVRSLDAAARKVIAEAGYGEKFTHSLGHGVGLDIHESPAVSGRSDEKLSSGMVITIEPGIYLPGKFGVRYENTIVV